MPTTDFDEYLNKFKPVKKKISSEYLLPVLTSKASALESRLEFLAREIRELYVFINRDLSKPGFIDFGYIGRFNTKIESLKTSLTIYCDTLASPTKQDFVSELDKTGQQLFSELLQHLFMYVADKYSDNTQYVNRFMGELLTNYPNHFFYVLDNSTPRETVVSLWEDPMQKETALITAIRDGEFSIVRDLLTKLKQAFFIEKQVITEIPITFEDYLFHETTEGFSALSAAWQRGNEAIMNGLVNYAESIYGIKGTTGFQRFAFQIDQQGTTSLMRAGERGDLTLVRLLLGGVRTIYETPTHSDYQKFLLYQDLNGLTVLNRVSQAGEPKIIIQLLSTATIAFGGKNSDGFKNFLNLADNKGTSPFISAAIHGQKKTLKLLFEAAEQAYGERSQTLRQFIFRQDVEGYTALMRVAENNQVASARFLLKKIRNFANQFEDSSDALYEAFMLKTYKGSSVFHLATQSQSKESLVALLKGLHLLFDKNTPEFHAILSQKDEAGFTALDNLVLEEKQFRELLERENRVASPTEKLASSKRAQMLGEFLSYGVKLPKEGDFSYMRNLVLRRPNPVMSFFNIFCSYFHRSKRAARTLCHFDESEYLSVFPMEPKQIRKEAFVSMVSFLNQANLDSLAEVAFIRNRAQLSVRERQELQKYNAIVESYYNEYSPSILRRFKQKTTNSLEDAWNRLSADYPYVLLDNGIDLLILNKAHIFSASLLNPAKAITLRSGLSFASIKDWLDSYFGSDYTVHLFDPEILWDYPRPLSTLNSPVTSDEKFLLGEIQGISRKTIQSLFLLKKVRLQLADLAAEDFFQRHTDDLSLRSENFHEVFFKLTLNEKNSLINLLLQQEFPEAQYENLSSEENEYLVLYKRKLITQLRISSAKFITPIDTLNLAIEVQEEFLDRESSLFSPEERLQVSNSLQQLKRGLTQHSENKLYGKAALQLIVLLFPNAIRGIVNKDPAELLTPAALIAADMGLRKLLVGFTKHPQVIKLFSGPLASKVLMLSEALERVPIVGSAFALYGLYESGKALVATAQNDPNRPYYAHLFVNNLVMVGLMGAELAVALPFWPVLGLFAILTIDQSVTEGRRIYDNELHLSDDKGHPFSRFFTELELGLGIVTDRIELVETQRVLFQTFLDYLDRIQTKNNYPLIAVSLPEVKVEEVKPTSNQKSNFLEGTLDLLAKLTIVPAPIKLGDSDQVTETRRLKVIRKTTFTLNVEPKVFCESIDSYYLSADEGYSLLTGQWVAPAPQGLESDCSIGQPQKKEVNAQASGKAGAAVVINKQALSSVSKQRYGLLLAIDPGFVRHYKVMLHPKKRFSQPFLSDPHPLLPCSDGSLAFCIDTIVVNIAPIYTISSNVRGGTTTVEIQTGDQLDNTNTNDRVQAIQYLLSTIDSVEISENKIANKTFAFFDKNHSLRFDGNFITSENGFKAGLSDTKILVLAFDKGVTVQGEVPVMQKQRVVISHLQGIDGSRMASFNATQCPSFAVSLGQYTEFSYKEQTIRIIAQNYSESLVNVYAEVAAPHLYCFTMPLNAVSYDTSYVNAVRLLISSTSQALASIYVMSGENSGEFEPTSFSGHYIINGEVFYSRLLVEKNQEEKWQCSLEINASTRNSTAEIDLTQIQKQNFNKVSVLTKGIDGQTLTHYRFCQTNVLPKVAGQFVGYYLEEAVKSYILVLKHAKTNPEVQEETQLFLLKENNGIVINNIYYRPNWSLFSLLAINAIDNSPIDGENLLAPLRIEKKFKGTKVLKENGIYTINGMAIKNVTSKLTLQFDDRQVPFLSLVYQGRKHELALVDQPKYSHSQLAKQVIISSPKVYEKATIFNKKVWDNLGYYLFVPIAAAAGCLSVGLTLFSKRFKAQPVTIPSAAFVPLLNVKKVEAISLESKKYENSWIEDSHVFFKKNFLNSPVRMDLLNGDKEYRNKTKESGSHGLVGVPFAELDSTIMLSRCALHLTQSFFGRSKKVVKKVSASKRVRKRMSYNRGVESVFFLTTSPASNASASATLPPAQAIDSNCIN
jgi:ankyrin repeat protein